MPKKVEMPKLIPCPFCGCEMKMKIDGFPHEYQAANLKGKHLKKCFFSQRGEYLWIGEQIVNLDGFKTLQEIADIWNTRTEISK